MPSPTNPALRRGEQVHVRAPRADDDDRSTHDDAGSHHHGCAGHDNHSSHQTQTAKTKTVAEKAYGKPGDAKQVKRTIAVDMNDTMRYTPSSLTMVRGETVKFELRNTGKVMHEFVLGTMADLQAHSEAMKKSPKMAHGDAQMVHVGPGKSGTMVWQFSKAGEFHFGCLLPGHFEAGMVGKITVTERP